jgi:hypothetical protein
VSEYLTEKILDELDRVDPDRERPSALAELVVAVAGLVLGAGIIAAIPLIKAAAVVEGAHVTAAAILAAFRAAGKGESPGKAAAARGADAAGEAFLATLVSKILGAIGA